MKKTAFLILFLIFNISFASQVKVPEVTFPVEITVEKIEQKPFLQPPDRLKLSQKIETQLFVEEFPPIPPYNVEPPSIPLEKPSSFMGIPEENALMAGAIDDFFNGKYLSARDKLIKLLKKYPDVKFKTEAKYLLGLVYYKLGEKEKALKQFENTCKTEETSPIRDKACLSAAILLLDYGKIKEADQLLKNAETPDENFLFWHGVIFAHNKKYKEAFNLIKDIKCENLNVEFIDYCKYMKGYLYFANKQFEKAVETLNQIKSPDYWRHILLIKGFSYLRLGDYAKAESYFKKYLEGYGTATPMAAYAIYGLGIIDLKKGNIKSALEKAGILETRDKTLAQNLYIKIAEVLADKGDFETAFVLLQKSALTGGKYVEYLKKKLAITAYNSGKYRYAFLMFKSINQPEFDLYAGYALLKLNRPQEAAEYIEKALDRLTDPEKKLQALKYLADIYFQLKQYKKYLQVVKEISQYDEDYARDLLGWYFFIKKEYKKAYQAFKDPYLKAISAFNAGLLDEALQIAQKINDRKSKLLIAYIFIKKQQPELARKVLEELSQGDDEIAQKASYLYAYTYFLQGDYLTAAQEFENFANRYPNTKLGKQAILRMANSYYNAGETEKAREIYRQFIEKYADSPEAIDAAYQLTLLEMKNSKDTDVATQIKKFIEKYPDYPFVNLLKIQLADYYLSKGKFDEAEKLYSQIIEQDIKESDYALYKLGYLYYLKNNYPDAINTLRQYLEKYPQGEYSLNAKSLLVKIYIKQKDLKKAIEVLKQMPDTDENRYQLAILYYKLGDLTQAKSYFEDLYTRFPKYRNDIAYYLAKIQLKLGYPQLAKKYLEEAVNGSDYNHVAESYYLLGLIYQQEGNLEKALNNFVNVVYLYPEAKEFVIKARIKAAEIMKSKGHKQEAACMLKPLKKYNLSPPLQQKVKQLQKGLPQCR
ncbi:tetratricopeptide repeat protein [Persephonella sp. KM09-Lau-8]|uniref:tetratricopeptide repeat protein n=1 Tax=Persephonella sp. KM09-Lau-8 TaxID=1158345 RepID=UPI0004955F65|nr:tetratricopeptide repeat protein [Persephonella sp. KM09-Lau-8]